MKLTELHHAAIVLGFYRELTALGDAGRGAFVKAAQVYGESRGRRMAMRALRDGNPLDFTSYFAYSEWESSPGAFDCTFQACTGYVDENVTRCPWADFFAEENARDCGTAYCAEIDRAIVRGFNPALVLDVLCTQHTAESCQFYFRGKAVTPELFEQVDQLLARPHGELVREFAFHCADLWHACRNITLSVFGEAKGSAIIAGARDFVVRKTSEEAMKTIERYDDTDFNRL